MDQLLVDSPGWLDWGWVLRVLDQEVRLAGEEVGQPRRRADDLVALWAQRRNAATTASVTAAEVDTGP